jgi:predicted nuclease of restriction endonuclease-like RecB superfamily
LSADAPRSYRLLGGAIVPRLLVESDYPWLRVLLDERERFVGRAQREFDARLRDPLPVEGPPGKKLIALRVLAQLGRSERRSPVPPRHARRLLFEEAAITRQSRDALLARVASAVGATPDDLESSLFADLPGERLLADVPGSLSPAELALRTNLSLIQGLLGRATGVTLEVSGNVRVLVRHAKLRGLLCTVSRPVADVGAVLDMSGPLALFRHTVLYGRALGSLIPHLAWCQRFRLRATCLLEDRLAQLQLATGDPIFPSVEPRRFDSQLEERFARDFRKVAPDWDVIREPEPIAVGTRLVFPDFALQHRTERSRRWLVELVGFWTPEYLRRKLALYREARAANLILCIAEDRGCTEEELPAGPVILRFRRWVDAAAVRRIVT